MGGRRRWFALAVLGAYFVALVLFQSRLTWENFQRQLHATETARAPFTLGPNDLVLNAVRPEAAAAGLARGDRLIAIGGSAARGQQSPQAAVLSRRAGEMLPVSVARNGAPVTVSIRLRASSAEPLTLSEWVLFVFLDVLTPWLCLILGFGVAFQRPLDPLAWLLLMLLMSFGGVAQAGRVVAIVAAWEVPTRPIAVLYYLTITNSWGLWMLLFGQYFPDRAAAGKWNRLIRLALGGVLAGYALLWGLSNALAIEDGGTMRFEAAVQRWSTVDVVLELLGIGVFFASIFWKMWRARMPDARRRLKLLVSGAGVSLTPVLILALTALSTGRPFTAFLTFSPWLWIPSLLLLFLFPVTLAYVIVVARAMEVDVVIRQGLQYALARGGARLLVGSVFLAMTIYSVRVAYEPGIARRWILLIFAVLAGVLVLLRLVSERLYIWIDRHFFREAVNTERVLGDLTQKVRTMVNAELLLQTVTETVSSALHVDRVAAMIRRNGEFAPAYALGFGPRMPEAHIAARSSLTQRFGRQGQPWRIVSAAEAVEDEEHGALKALGTELLLPLEANNHLLGFLSLGPKRSEAPYSASDIRLLEAVAVQTGLALENSRLAAEVARETAHRERMARELEIAREVQQRLFPQEVPGTDRLDYAGQCRPAATIGGDYYDFLPLPGGRLGFAIGDVSGKGIPAALLMASLRASLRGLAMAYPGAISEMMGYLNQAIYDASSSDRYATFFYGVFNPEDRTFRYVNAGHNPPMLFRAGSGEVVRLDKGGLLLGGFRSVKYEEASVTFAPGDTMVLFTDGISEAVNAAGKEFGEERIIAVAERGRGVQAGELVDQMMGAVEEFTGGVSQFDDMTLVVVRVL